MTETQLDRAPAAPPARTRSPFVSVTELQAARAAGQAVVLLDARFDSSGLDGAALAAADRIPGAVHVDVTHELAGAPGALTGRLPLPDLRDLQRDVRRWGIADDSTVVVYDDGKGTLAARAWWVLRWAGLKDVAILDGGVLAWRAAGGALTFEAGLARRGGATLSGGHLKQIDAAEALAIARNGHLFDGRGRDAYEGQPGQPKTGHIPGAYSLPAGALQDSDGRLKPPEALRDWLAGQGLADLPPDGVAAYCGAGSAASYVVAALQTVGIDAALFPGSWTEWVKDPARPIAQGAGRG